jgi:hypothetical protein
VWQPRRLPRQLLNLKCGRQITDEFGGVHMSPFLACLRELRAQRDR